MTLKEMFGYAENVRQVCHLHLLLLFNLPALGPARLRVNYAGLMYGKMCLIIIDAHLKWIEPAFVPSATSAATIELLCNSFARFGLPSSVVTDNAPYFVSEKIEFFFKQNGIRHPTSLPYHPASKSV